MFWEIGGYGGFLRIRVRFLGFVFSEFLGFGFFGVFLIVGLMCMVRFRFGLEVVGVRG